MEVWIRKMETVRAIDRDVVIHLAPRSPLTVFPDSGPKLPAFIISALIHEDILIV